jgi:hypothetical protein
MEQWKDVIGFVGYYQVSDQGRGRSVDRVVPHGRGFTRRLRGQIMSLGPLNRYGHLGLGLSKNGVVTSFLVHQLVAAAWIGPCPDGQQVRHGPAGHLDNSVGNLCYGTGSQDGYDKRRDGTHGGRPVRRSDGVEFINMHVAAEETGCRYQNISKVCRGLRTMCGGYGWRYASEPGPDVWTVSAGKGRCVRRSDGEEYPSATQAAEDTGCNASSISKVCRGITKTAGGYGWEYAD